jgi:hypothetical protein
MAKSFSTKQYFKKIHTPGLLTELYKRHDITALFEITEQTARKNVIAILNDFHASVEPEQRIDIERELALVESVSTVHGTLLFSLLLAKHRVSNDETYIECVSDHDRALYYYLFKKDIFDEALFFHRFYVQPNYMLYEAKTVALEDAELNHGELIREFTRIANKEDRVTECTTEIQSLNGLLYVNATFEGAPILSVKRNSKTGDIEKTNTTKKIEEVRIVYIPQEQEVLISYTGSKYEKLIFLDTFLRIICDSMYEEKVEVYDLSDCKQEAFDFSKTNQGVPLLTWKIKSATVSFGVDAKMRKRIRLTLPSTQQEYGLAPLFSCLRELDMTKQFGACTVENVALSFSFTDKHKSDKSVTVQATVSLTKASLCPLFFYHNYARTLLKQSGIRKGFVEVAKKEKDDVTKKWEA